MTAPHGPGDERDAHLVQALRHAPDAEATPPAAVSQAILRAAREQAGTSRHGPAPGIAGRFLAAWSWLARPPVAAGFASLMLATLVGLSWWGRPIEDGLRTPEVPAVASASSEAAPAPAPAPSPEPLPPAAPKGMADAAPARRPGAEAVAGAVAPPVAGAKVATAPTRAALALREAAAPSTPSVAPLAALRADPRTLSWRLGSDAVQPMNEALSAWLARVDTLRFAARSTGQDADEPGALELHLLAEGRAPARLRLGASTLRIDQADGHWLAVLETGQAEALRAALQAATR